MGTVTGTTVDHDVLANSDMSGFALLSLMSGWLDLAFTLINTASVCLSSYVTTDYVQVQEPLSLVVEFLL